MGNQNNRNGNNGNGGGYNVPPRQDPASLAAGLEKYVQNLNVNGVYCLETSDSLMALTESTIVSLGLTQVDRVMIKPAMRRGDAGLDGISAAVSFDLTSGTEIRANTVDKGNNNSNLSQQELQQSILWKNSGIKQYSGEFKTSDLFRQVMTPIASEFTDNDEIIVRKPPASYGRNVGVVIVDFMELLRMSIGMKEDDNYNFTIVNSMPISKNKYQFGILVYIDANTRRRKGRRNNNVDYQGMTDYLFS